MTHVSFCGNCGAQADSSSQCPSCGRESSAGTSFCVHCGARTLPERRYCPGCGKACAGTRFRRSKATAAALAFLFGGIGLHKFYLGSWGWGLVYIAILLVSGLSVLLGIAEGIHFVTMEAEEFGRRYNRRRLAPFDW